MLMCSFELFLSLLAIVLTFDNFLANRTETRLLNTLFSVIFLINTI